MTSCLRRTDFVNFKKTIFRFIKLIEPLDQWRLEGKQNLQNLASLKLWKKYASKLFEKVFSEYQLPSIHFLYFFSLIS